MKNQISSSLSTGLDLLRVFAALCVLIGHSFAFYDLTVLCDESRFPYIQSMAVIIFFLLSGFLTMHTFLSKSPEYEKFIISRFVRIYSFYLPSLLCVAFIDGLSCLINYSGYQEPHKFNIVYFIASLFMLYARFGTANPIWTLFIEWWLYVVVGYFALKILKGKSTKICNIGFMVICVCMLLVLDKTCMIVFGIGMLIYAFYQKVTVPNVVQWALIVVSVVMVFAFGLKTKNAYDYREVLSISCFFLCYVWIWDKKAILTSKALRKWGGWTFPLYLVHYSIIECVINIFSELSVIEQFIISTVLSIVVSLAIYLIVEKYIMGKKKYYEDFIYNLWTSRIKRVKK